MSRQEDRQRLTGDAEERLARFETLEKLLASLQMLRKPWHHDPRDRWWIERTDCGEWDGPFEAVEVATLINIGMLDDLDRVINAKSQRRYVICRERFLVRWRDQSSSTSTALLRGLSRAIRRRGKRYGLELRGLNPTILIESLTDEERAAFELLELDPMVTKEQLRRRHRELALANHPDRGGSVEKMAEINRAFDIAQAATV
jgi:hypothetical protein